MTKVLRITFGGGRVGLAFVAALMLLGTTGTKAQHHDHSHDHGHSDGGIHAPHYQGVPHGASDIVKVHGDHGGVVFYSRYHHSHGHHGHQDYYCRHDHDSDSDRIGFGEHAHVHDLAHGLMETMRQADEDMHANYHGNHGFDVTLGEMHNKFVPCVKRLDELADAGDYNAAKAEFRHVVENLNHLENDVRHWHRHHHRQIGRGGLLTKIADMRSLVAHLANDLGTHSDRDARYH